MGSEEIERKQSGFVEPELKVMKGDFMSWHRAKMVQALSMPTTPA